MRPGRPVLVDSSGGYAHAAQGWSDRVEISQATVVDGPAALLIRPDGYVAWAADGFDDPGLTGAMQRWFGAANAGADELSA